MEKLFGNYFLRKSHFGYTNSDKRMFSELIPQTFLRKRGGVQKSMGNKVPWKIGVLIYLPVTSRPLISLQKEACSSPRNFATTLLTACILNFYLP